MTYAWVAPLDGQLDLLLRWLGPILERLETVPLQIVVHETDDDAGPDVLAVEPIDALVGPVRAGAGTLVADVIPVEPFAALRTKLGGTGPYAPQVVLARGDVEPLEANASGAIVVTALHRIRACS